MSFTVFDTFKKFQEDIYLFQMKHNHNLCQEKKKECYKTWSETQQKSRPTATANRPTYQQKLCVSWSSKRRLHSFKVSAYDCPKENGAEHSRSDVLKESYLRSWIATFSANANLHSFTHLIPFGLLSGFLKISCYSTWWFCPPHSASPSNLRQAWEMAPREDLFADEVSALPRAFDGLWLESYVAGMLLPEVRYCLVTPPWWAPTTLACILKPTKPTEPQAK